MVLFLLLFRLEEELLPGALRGRRFAAWLVSPAAPLLLTPRVTASPRWWLVSAIAVPCPLRICEMCYLFHFPHTKHDSLLLKIWTYEYMITVDNLEKNNRGLKKDHPKPTILLWYDNQSAALYLCKTGVMPVFCVIGTDSRYGRAHNINYFHSLQENNCLVSLKDL